MFPVSVFPIRSPFTHALHSAALTGRSVLAPHSPNSAPLRAARVRRMAADGPPRAEQRYGACAKAALAYSSGCLWRCRCRCGGARRGVGSSSRACRTGSRWLGGAATRQAPYLAFSVCVSVKSRTRSAGSFVPLACSLVRTFAQAFLWAARRGLAPAGRCVTSAVCSRRGAWRGAGPPRRSGAVPGWAERGRELDLCAARGFGTGGWSGGRRRLEQHGERGGGSRRRGQGGTLCELGITCKLLPNASVGFNAPSFSVSRGSTGLCVCGAACWNPRFMKESGCFF